MKGGYYWIKETENDEWEMAWGEGTTFIDFGERVYNLKDIFKISNRINEPPPPVVYPKWNLDNFIRFKHPVTKCNLFAELLGESKGLLHIRVPCDSSLNGIRAGIDEGQVIFLKKKLVVVKKA